MLQRRTRQSAAQVLGQRPRAHCLDAGVGPGMAPDGCAVARGEHVWMQLHSERAVREQEAALVERQARCAERSLPARTSIPASRSQMIEGCNRSSADREHVVGVTGAVRTVHQATIRIDGYGCTPVEAGARALK